MEDANDGATSYHPEAVEKYEKKTERRSKSEVWEHFTKIIKENGRCEACQCNYCQKLFSCSSRSGTNHLRRHITNGICPALKGENKVRTAILSSCKRVGMKHANAIVPFKLDSGLGQSSAHQRVNVKVESQTKGGAWMNEFRTCVSKLVELANGTVPSGSHQSLAVGPPDYSLAAAVKCLDEMEDIPQASDMYLDAVSILRDAVERECFLSLPPEPRRRWLQRVLHRHHPLRYRSNVS